MMDRIQVAVALRGANDLISDLYNDVLASPPHGVEVDEPAPAVATSDALDSPIGADQIPQMLLLVGAGFALGKEALSFMSEIVKWLHTRREERSIDVTDFKSGRVIVVITENSDPKALLAALMDQNNP